MAVLLVVRMKFSDRDMIEAGGSYWSKDRLFEDVEKTFNDS